MSGSRRVSAELRVNKVFSAVDSVEAQRVRRGKGRR